MLKRSIYTLLVATMALNIGAGIWFNGIPGIFDSPRDSILEKREAASGMVIPPSRIGDIYTTSYNMTLNYQSGEDVEEEGTYHQDGTVIRSIGSDIIVRDLVGVFDLWYNKTGAPELRIFGDMERTRTTFRDLEGKGWKEDMETTMTATTSNKKQRQTSELTLHLEEPQRKWSERIMMDLKEQCGALNGSSEGVITNSLSIEEIGYFSPEVDLGWSVRSVTEANGPRSCWIDISSKGPEGPSIRCSIRFSEDSPYPLETELFASKLQNSASDSTYFEIIIREKLLDHFSGDGELVQEMDVWKEEDTSPDLLGNGDLLPEEGSGENAFWSSPQEVFEHSSTNSRGLSDFIDICGMENIGYRRITYARNESLPSTVKDWNITLGSDPISASGQGYYIKVAASRDLGMVSRRWMEVSDEGSLPGTHASAKRTDVISLEEFDSALRSSKLSEKMFVGSEHSSTFGMEIIRRGADPKGALSSLLVLMMGLQRAPERDIFIGHVQDRGDPLKMYFVVVDGYNGGIISTAEVSGLSTLLINRYGIDPA